jgi:hypothetical protein
MLRTDATLGLKVSRMSLVVCISIKFKGILSLYGDLYVSRA